MGEAEPKSTPEKTRRFSLRLFLLLAVIGLIVPVAYFGLADLYQEYVEISAPKIEVLELPRGIGIAPVTMQVRFSDSGAGLDEVIIRARQRNRTKELLRRKLKGAHHFEEQITFAGTKSNFQEGVVDIEIIAFDRAFWSNRGESLIQLPVDYHKPKIEVLTTQHNARHGGSQLIFYRAFDEEIALSGVKVGSRVFQGFRAKGLDSAFEDPNLFVAFYAIDLKQSLEQLSIRVFAEDRAGNGISTDFYNKVLERPVREVSLGLAEEFLRSTATQLVEENISKLHSALADYDSDPFLVDVDPLVKRFKVLNEVLRGISQTEISNQLEATPRFESYLQQYFLRQPGTTRIHFGDKINFLYAGKAIGQTVSQGNEFVLPNGQRDIVAVNDGIVILSEIRGTYGRVVAIDHGLGVASLYAQLDEIKVRKGDLVKRGEILGTQGASGFALKPSAYLEMRVQGVAVDPLEWWDANWFNQHVIGKINEIKLSLGIQVVKPL